MNEFKSNPPRASHPLRPVTLTLAGAALIFGLQACNEEDDPPPPAATTVNGTVATGAGVAGATVTIKDADAATADVTVTTAADGSYTADVSALKAPLVLSATGTLNGEPVALAAVVPTLTGSSANTANVTPLTHAVAALLAPGGDPAALASAAAIGAIGATAASDASALVVNTLKSNPAFASALGADFDPLKTPFAANGTGIDAVLDQLEVRVDSAGVAITNLTAPASGSGQAAPVTLTAAQVANPTSAPALPASTSASDLPTTAEMLALAKKMEACLALPLEQRVTLDSAQQVQDVSAACRFGPDEFKSDGGGWADRVGMSLLRHPSSTGAKVGTPTIAVVLAPPHHTGTTFQHPYCNTQTCVIMNVPMTSASGRPANSTWFLGRLGGQWNFVGNHLPYAMGVEQRLLRRQAVNTAHAAANPTNYFLQDRMESVIRLGFNPVNSGAGATANIRAVVWKGPGLPAAGIVMHRSTRCGTDDRFTISNQEGQLVVNNSSTVHWVNNNSANDFIVDASKPDGTALALPTPTTHWTTNAAPANQDVRSGPFTGTVPAWAVYTAEIYYFTNNGTTPDEVVNVRTGTPYERAAIGATKNWPVLAPAFIDQYLKPTGSQATSITSLAQTMAWTNPADGYVFFTYLFSSNRASATNSQSETALYWKRGLMFFRPAAAGDSSAGGYEWATRDGQSSASLSSHTANLGTNPNPRCTGNEVLPLDADGTRFSYREAGLQFRGPDRKLYQLTHFWSNN